LEAQSGSCVGNRNAQRRQPSYESKNAATLLSGLSKGFTHLFDILTELMEGGCGKYALVFSLRKMKNERHCNSLLTKMFHHPECSWVRPCNCFA
jgi:hypothetical protein